MALVSVSEAARLANVARSTLYAHYINRGKLSVQTDGRGRRVIDTDELLRVFSKLRGTGQPDKGLYRTGQWHDDRRDSRAAVLEAENRLLREQLAAAGQREAWYQRQLEDLGQTVRLLEDGRASGISDSETVKEPAKRRWWFLRNS
ncbi:MAG TPA: helix-turn-helix domain-containing protein [Piscinibacter sp.]|jgi:hypothetical protein|uniref:helix-turn-helix domain-containing protein n=1 Tax=Pseudomonadota TaxID=1224 RepID=UPI002CFC3150|nr:MULTISPECIES: helix-turn-helix domain-containing protein [Pseudomonadota]HMY99708.1 helix-turn-helix domain-containing protein [Burkholderiaceae bacterium]HNK17719.1 helix-turn-helix domain-containing protein [Piscinibacter sp.]HNG49710.1 helix-turn-helix domain-containing protein [Plasticicumulans sp.]HNG49715.1 helix-turn-helix domain-containing protein [Plasticicumulans sp.]HNL98209.1 helix-turn-helix domain-containing protein [Accumulibacter sp.]